MKIVAFNQSNFIKVICNMVRDDLLDLVKNGKIPSEWDGHELRHLIKDRAARVAVGVMFNDKKRKKNYTNHCIVNNIP